MTAKTTEKETGDRQFQRRYLWTQWSMVVISLGVAIAASWNLIVLHKTFKQTRHAAGWARDAAHAAIKANELTKKANIIAQSAFVYIGEVSHTREPTKKDKFPKQMGTRIQTGVNLTIQSKNSGITPARNVQVQSTYCIHTGSGFPDLPKDFSFPVRNPFEAPYMMPPGGDFTSFREITEAELAKARTTPNTLLYVWGTIVYDDIFHRHHRTEFCTFYRGELILPDGTIRPQFSFCNRHNCEDDDCPDSWGNNDYDCGPKK